MILDALGNSARYEALHPLFPAAFAFLRAPGIADLPVGKHAIEGERLLVIIGRDAGRTRGGAKLESHRKYIDIQLTLAGNEEIGWCPLAECREVSQPYDADRDIMFFADWPLAWSALPPGKFMIFYPEDAHAPLAGVGDLHKAVVKVAV